MKEKAGSAIIISLLFLGTLFLFARACGEDFLDFDDPDYVTQNIHVQGGLSWPDMKWAFQSCTAGNWHPLTWLSHMLDWQMFGKDPRGHHATSVLLHALNAVLAFLVGRQLTGKVWLSAAGAALFAWHPLRVESVAWIAERKDVLSAFFFLLTLLAYSSYVSRMRQKFRGAKYYYALTILLFAFGLMCKPMVVTLPGLLLLLDFWPLRRFGETSSVRLVSEKLPLFALSVAVGAITYHAQKMGGAIVENLPPATRLEHAVMAIPAYLGDIFWPVHLAVPYPLPAHVSVPAVITAGMAVLLASVVAMCQYRQRPWLMTGWFWFLILLSPVLGLVQAGDQAMADRYTYLPVIGLQWGLLWSAGEMTRRFKLKRVGGAAMVLLLTLLAGLTWRQIGFWHDSRTLYEHALAVTKDNYLAESNLGTTLFNAGDSAGAEAHFRRAVEMNPAFATAHLKLGITLEKLNRPQEALAAYEDLLKLRPRDVRTHYNAGVLLLNQDRAAEAIGHFQAATEIQPDNAEAFAGLGIAQSQAGQTAAAIRSLEQALRLEPDLPGGSNTLAELRRALPAGQQ